MTELSVEIKYSTRRKKTLSAVMKNNILIISAPQNVTSKVLNDFIVKAKRKFYVSEENKKTDLHALSLQLMKKYFPLSVYKKIGQDFSIQYVSNQKNILGNCHYKKRIIRLSDFLMCVPDWVRNYVILHELAHLLEPNHSTKFWEIVESYPRTKEAKSFLKGVFFGVSHYKQLSYLKTFESF